MTRAEQTVGLVMVAPGDLVGLMALVVTVGPTRGSIVLLMAIIGSPLLKGGTNIIGANCAHLYQLTHSKV